MQGAKRIYPADYKPPPDNPAVEGFKNQVAKDLVWVMERVKNQAVWGEAAARQEFIAQLLALPRGPNLYRAFFHFDMKMPWHTEWVQDLFSTPEALAELLSVAPDDFRMGVIAHWVPRVIAPKT